MLPESWREVVADGAERREKRMREVGGVKGPSDGRLMTQWQKLRSEDQRARRGVWGVCGVRGGGCARERRRRAG